MFYLKPVGWLQTLRPSLHGAFQISVPLFVHVVIVDEPYRQTVDAIAQTATVFRAVVEDMAEMRVADPGLRTSVRSIPKLLSLCSVTTTGEMGLVKLGQPQRE